MTLLDETELVKMRDSWEKLENNLKIVQSLQREQFDNIDSAKIPQYLDMVHVLHHDEFEYQYLPVQTSEGKKRVKRPSAHFNNGLTTVSIFYGGTNTKAKKDSDEETTTLTPAKTVPRLIYPILEYLHGTTAFYKNNLYLISGQQFELLSELKISERYKLSNSGSFKVSEIVKMLEFIHSKLKLEPLKAIKTATIACKDFQLDLHGRKLMTDKVISADETYFKVFDCSYREVMDILPEYGDFLDMVTDGKDSMHNASLQPVYTMLVACREDSKARFFVSKSSTRTGKGLRQKVISSIFNAKSIELDNLVNSGFEGLNAWAQLDGGEFLLATEQGAITGKTMERVLKIIATEDKNAARLAGGNSGQVNLTGVLSIDSNEKVLLSKDMNSRAVNIGFENRPDGETDSERYKVFEPYWEVFTIQTQEETSKQATKAAGMAALIHSFLYWKSEGYKFNFRLVEMNNFINDYEFDDLQSYLLDLASKGQKVFIKSEDDTLRNLLKDTYLGQRQGTRKTKLDEIGLYETARNFVKDDGYKSLRVIAVKRPRVFQQAIEKFVETSIISE